MRHYAEEHERHEHSRRISHAHPVPVKIVDDDAIANAPEGQTMASKALSRKKKMLDMADGDEHFVSNLRVGPVNDMYLAIRAYSMFPHGIGLPALVHDTQAGGRK